MINKVVALCKCDREVAAIVNIERRYDGRYDVSFPYYKNAHSINAASIRPLAKIKTRKHSKGYLLEKEQQNPKISEEFLEGKIHFARGLL